MLQIIQVTDLPNTQFTFLKQESIREGLTFLKTLEVNWLNDNQRFDKEGEGVFLLKNGMEIIGIGVLQCSPFAPPTVGIALLTNCYVLKKERKKGYGHFLYRGLIAHARNYFGMLQLEEACPIEPKLRILEDYH